ncbi:MAG: hypothetical protein Q8S06_10095, partial [Methanobacteriaceae archaeon]|nr:hypothetical protein [Methanobacteriaceae archaeon]
KFQSQFGLILAGQKFGPFWLILTRICPLKIYNLSISNMGILLYGKTTEISSFFGKISYLNQFI